MDFYEHKASIMWETMRCEDCRGEGYAAKRFDRVGVELESGESVKFQLRLWELALRTYLSDLHYCYYCRVVEAIW